MPGISYPLLSGSQSEHSWVSGRYDGYALQLSKGSPLTGYVTRSGAIPGEPAEIFVRFAWLSSAGNEQTEIILIDSDQTPGLIKLLGGTSNPISVYVNGTNVLTSAYVYPSPAAWILIELHVALGTNGLVEIRINGAQSGTWSGNTAPNGDTKLNTFYVRHTGAFGSVSLFDDLAINDTSGVEDNAWCGDGHIVAVRPVANGPVIAWEPSAGSNWENVDDVTPDGDATFVRSITPGDVDTYVTGDISLPIGYRVGRLWVEAVGRKEGAGTINTLAVGIKAGTTEAWSSPVELGSAYMVARGTEYTLNPHTGETWTEQDVNDLLIAIKHIPVEE